MLKTRIITALVLLVGFFCALFYLPSVGWLGLAALVTALAFWEWGGLMKLSNAARLCMGGLGFVVVAILSALFPFALGVEVGGDFAEAAWNFGRWFYIPSAAFWLLLVPLWLRKRWSVQHPVAGVLAGIVVILPTWLALVQLRQLGGWALLAVMAIVWLADSAAYFSGRALGRHKLAPTISPGKTWEGAIGGALAVLIYGFLLSSKLPGSLADNKLLLFVILALLAAISIVGDLFESLLKRQSGLKDSSNILPGHGGVLDRIDSLTSTLPLVALAWLGLSF